MCIKKACEEKDYELQSTQVHVKEIEDKLEEELYKDEESSRMPGDEDLEEDSKEEEDNKWKQCLKVDAMMQEIRKDIKRNNDLEKEKIVEKVHFSLQQRFILVCNIDVKCKVLGCRCVDSRFVLRWHSWMQTKLTRSMK